LLFSTLGFVASVEGLVLFAPIAFLPICQFCVD